MCNVICDTLPDQIAAYCVSALAGGTMLHLWRRMGEEERQRVWRLYGYFTGLIVTGSCVGVITWASRMMQFVRLIEYKEYLKTSGNRDVAQGWRLFADTMRWNAA